MTTLRARRGRRAIIVILMAVLAVVLLGFVGLAVDVGYFESSRHRAQIAADTAAIAAVQEALVYPNATDSQLIEAGRTAASLNGFSDGVNSTSVALSRSGQEVTVSISRTAPTFFSSILRSNFTMNVQAKAKLQQNNAGCVYALQPTGSRTLMHGGQSDLITDCAIRVNSSASDAIYWDSGACTTAASISTAGNFFPAASQWPYQGGCGLSPESFTRSSSQSQTLPITTAAATAADPFVSFPVPTGYSTACDPAHTNLTIDSSTQPGGTLTLNPGTYCGGIYIGGGRTVVFNPGTYICLNGRGFTADTNTNVSGNGVFFYVHGDPGTNTPVLFSSSGVTASFTAPTSGPYQGMLFLNDSNNANLVNQVNGNANAVFSGSIYFPYSQLLVSGSGSRLNVMGNSKVVAQKITVNGQGTLQLLTGSSSGGSGTAAGIVLTQ